VRLAAFLTDFCERHRLPPDVDMALNLAAEEVFMNVVMHGEGASHVEVSLTRGAGDVTLTIKDDAPEFDPLQAPEFDPATPLEQRRTGGLGIHLLRNLMTELRYERVAGNNVLTLKKTIPEGAAA
jgi:serine/threonine-protein kinase RsbW